MNFAKKGVKGVENINLFENKRIRSCLDKATGKRWFSVVDICSVLTGSDYKTARNYWKWLKSRLRKQQDQSVSITNQLKMEAADGKLRRTDVMDAEDVLKLIQECPSPKAEAFKAWLLELTAKGEDAVKYLNEAVSKIKHRVGNLLFTICRKEFKLFESEEPCTERHAQGYPDEKYLTDELTAA